MLVSLFGLALIAGAFSLLPVDSRAAFPSLHTAASLVALVYAWRFARRWFYVLLPFVLGLWVSTIYLRHHYFVDLLAGWILAPIAILLALGGLGWANFNLNMFLNVMTPLIMVISFSDSMQLTFAARDRLIAGQDKYTAFKNAVLVVGPACVLTHGTAGISFIALMFVSVYFLSRAASLRLIFWTTMPQWTDTRSPGESLPTRRTPDRSRSTFSGFSLSEKPPFQEMDWRLIAAVFPSALRTSPQVMQQES